MSTNQVKTTKKRNLEKANKGMKIYQIIVIPPFQKLDEKFSTTDEPRLLYFIGSTTTPLANKLSLHKSVAKRCVDNTPLHKIMRIPGYSFEIALIKDCLELSYLEAKKREQALIDASINDLFCLNNRKVSIKTNSTGFDFEQNTPCYN